MLALPKDLCIGTLSFAHLNCDPGMVSHPPISVKNLADVIECLKSNDGEAFSREFESIEPGQQFTWDASSREVNKGKNRYANVITYDHSRVILQTLDDVPGSDYINANYMDGYCRHNAYIATQVIIICFYGKSFIATNSNIQQSRSGSEMFAQNSEMRGEILRWSIFQMVF